MNLNISSHGEKVRESLVFMSNLDRSFLENFHKLFPVLLHATSILYLHTNLTRLNLLGSNIFSFSFSNDIVQMVNGRSAKCTLTDFLVVVCKKAMGNFHKEEIL